MRNAITNLDFYKTGHKEQYPKGTNKVYSNLTPRSARLFNGSSEYDDKVVVFGLQMFIKNFLMSEFQESFFNADVNNICKRYKRRVDNALGGDIDISHIKSLHKLGYLPIEIKALAEGTRSPIKVPVLTITNTIDEFFWLVNYLETVMSTELWKPITTATIAYEYKRIFLKYAELTGASVEFIPFQGHDFSARGLSNREDGYKASIGHLTSFAGTDTVRAIDGAEDFYGANSDKELVGVSVPATEHSVMCMGTLDDEIGTFKRLISELYPTGIVSIVSDTWDFWKVMTEYTVTLKDEIMSRDGKVVFRPDSGDPVDIICGTSSEAIILMDEPDDFDTWKLWVAENIHEIFCGELDAEEPMYSMQQKFKFKNESYIVEYTPDLNRHDKTYYYVDNYGSLESNCTYTKEEQTPESKGAIEVLWDVFGGTVNNKGFKVLDPHVGLIYGDSITLARQEEILQKLMKKGFSSDNIVFGIGSYSYQYNTRDTFGIAMKATYGEVNGVGREIFKDPATDSGTKKSARGLLSVEADPISGDIYLYDQVGADREAGGLLKTVFKDGELVVETTLEEIRERLS